MSLNALWSMWLKLLGVPQMTRWLSGFVSMSIISLVIISLGTMLASSMNIQSGWKPRSLSGEHGNATSLLLSGGFRRIVVRVVPGCFIICRISGFACMVW